MILPIKMMKLGDPPLRILEKYVEIDYIKSKTFMTKVHFENCKNIVGLEFYKNLDSCLKKIAKWFQDAILVNVKPKFLLAEGIEHIYKYIFQLQTFIVDI